jgi:hypothetical protein
MIHFSGATIFLLVLTRVTRLGNFLAIWVFFNLGQIFYLISSPNILLFFTKFYKNKHTLCYILGHFFDESIRSLCLRLPLRRITNKLPRERKSFFLKKFVLKSAALDWISDYATRKPVNPNRLSSFSRLSNTLFVSRGFRSLFSKLLEPRFPDGIFSNQKSKFG